MKKKRKDKLFNKNQKSFYFEDYIHSNRDLKKNKKNLIIEDRIYVLFFSFLALISIFSFKIIIISIQSPDNIKIIKDNTNFLPLRNDIIDRNGILLSRNIQAYHAAIKPSLIKDKKKFLLKIKIALPETNLNRIKGDIYKKKYFYLKRRLTEEQHRKLWSLGEKGLIFEPFQTRVYPHSELYSHIIGQIDYENYGISGVENYFDKSLRNTKKQSPLTLSLDTNIQFIVNNELQKAMKTFKALGAASVLLNANNGEVISLVSLPNYNINKRININQNYHMNKITKGVFELGSIFKTFTVALGIEEKIFNVDTIIKDIPHKMKCSVHEISDIKKFPENMSVEDILIQSSNLGTVKIAQKIGEKKYRKFIEKLELLNTSSFELDEVGTPLPFSWNKCKLETVSYGHGITTTPLQAAAAYASIINGGIRVYPTLVKNKKTNKNQVRIISEDTSEKIRKILRKVVTDEKGTARFADIFGYNVSGKTGTSQYYQQKNKNINTFISLFSAAKEQYVLLVMLDDPQIATELSYDYKGYKIKGMRNEAGWNSVYVAGKIIEKIGPILAINSDEITIKYAAKKSN